MTDKERIEQLEKQILEIAETIQFMHKPEYATFFIGEEQVDGYEYADRIRETLTAHGEH